MREKVAACVVLYHPTADVIQNIESYYPHTDILIAIDNSEEKDNSIEKLLIHHFERIIYKPLNDNTGIAAALNIACDIAIKNDMDWVLTMDQDSRFLKDSLPVMIKDITSVHNHFGKTGIITPYHVLAKDINKSFTEEFTTKNIAMTSGNLLSLKAYLDCGKFDEKLFMDFVDYEYCLRLRKKGYSIIQDNKIKLKHALGNFHMRPLLHKKIPVSNHNHQRRYYITRNSLYVAFKYYKTDFRFFLMTLYSNFLLSPFIILFYEEKKRSKLKSMVNGFFDFVKGNYGKKFTLKMQLPEETESFR